MKAILISIKPEWTLKIFNSEKTIEIRKTKPNCELPIKVYIYCTKPKRWFIDSPFTMFSYEELWIQDNKIYNGKEDSLWNPKFNHYYHLNGRVVAEFTLNKIDTIEICDPDVLVNGEIVNIMDYKKASCLSLDDFMDYIGYGSDNDGWGNKEWDKGFGWHIDNLKIYDKPKELSEFSTTLHRMKGKQTRYTSHLLQRPPQSWCYVEDLAEA